MKFSVNWLREFVELPPTTAELADLLTMAGVEIEGVEARGGDFPNVVVAQIDESVQHPNADRLSVCQVNDGSGVARQVVCGAKNYKPGDKVPLALPGAALPNGLKIKASKLRGVESLGMLCSPSELAISEDGDGLLILPPDAPVGAAFGSLVERDTILDVEITPNRSDLLSHLGLAREIAALTGQILIARTGECDVAATGNGISIEAANECPFYSARRIEGITVGPSPGWLRTKLEAAGLRSINNIVDITNYVMLELGQPLHAFDADKLQGDINVRLAHPGERFLALDGREYSLSERDLMIADAQKAVGIAGVMGGEDTGVTESTRNVLLEAAYFLPASVRRTARTLNLPSDASYRFERGIDPAMTLPASARAAELIREIAGGSPEPEIRIAGTPPSAPADVRLRYSRCNRLLGVELRAEEIDAILKAFGLRPIGETSATASSWKIPSYRADLQREADLIEEVVRGYGVDKIPSTDRSRFTPESQSDRSLDFQARLRQRLIALGVFEARTSTLISRAVAGGSSEGAVQLKNPLSEDQVALRPTLISGLIDIVGHNLNQGARTIRVFEIGRIFRPPDAVEQLALGLVFTGDVASTPHWRHEADRRLDIFDLKGAVTEALRLADLRFRRAERPGLVLAVKVIAGEEPLGFVGQLDPKSAASIGANAAVFVSEINLEAVSRAKEAQARFSEIDRFPAVARDVAMIVPENLSHADVIRTIRESNEPLVAEIQLFDLFSGSAAASIGENRKSLAYTLTYRDKNRTLTNDEVAVVHTRIRERLKSELGAELRE